MKEDLNIEKLFKQKFENFEGNVDPSAWANISQSIGAGASGAGAAGAAGGLSGFAKVAIIVGAAAVTAVGIWQFSGDSDEPTNEVETTIVSDNNNQDNTTEEVVISENDNSEIENINVENEDNNLVEDNNDAVNVEDNNNGDNSDLNSGNDLSGDNNRDNSDNNSGDGTSGDGDPNISDSNNGDLGNGNPDDEEPEVDKLIIVADPMVSTIDGNVVSFISNAQNVDEVIWDFGDGNTATGINPEHEYASPDNYNVKVQIKKSKNGRSIQKSYTLQVQIQGTSEITEVPNVFTPNGDNHNDYFYIESKDIKEFKIIIYEMMSGREVFQSTDVDFKWDGKDYNGAVNKGRYVYQIYAVGNDGSEIKLNGPLTINL